MARAAAVDPGLVMVVAGEASGDQHASELVRELKAQRPGLRFFGMGGPKLAAQGVELIHGAHEVSVMGITEVLPKLFRILKVMRDLAGVARERRPAVAVLVDIPDFNLRLAKQLKAMGIRVAYYVSPMIWAWRRGRVKQIARRVDRMLCILPFEEQFYRDAGVDARYVGSPVLEQMPAPGDALGFRRQLGVAEQAPTLALLPGSRMSEIRRILPAMVGAARALAQLRPGLQVLVPVAPSVPREVIVEGFAGSGVTPLLISGQAPEVVGASDAAVVASGTAALEAGLMRRPFVVVYRVSALSYLVGRLLIRVAHVALVNLLVNRRVVPELLQGEMRPEVITAELTRLWSPGPDREALISGLDEARATLGAPGAAARAAQAVAELLPAGP